MATPPPPAPQSDIDVTPSVLYGLSGYVASQQDVLHRGANALLDELGRYPDCGGYGTAAWAFAAAYLKVGNRFLDVWAKAVVSVGGAAVGFTVTANNYATADAATDPSGAPAHTQPPPAVIDNPPNYPSVTDLKWADVDQSQDIFQLALEAVETGVLAIIRPLLEDVFRFGKAAEIMPLPDYLGLDNMSIAWMSPVMVITTVDGYVGTALNGVTDRANNEWYVAMRQFHSAIWGTSAWGKDREGFGWKHDQAQHGQRISHPVMEVLVKTCDVVSDALRAWAEAAEDVRNDLRRLYYEAVIKALPHIDTSDGLGMKDLKSLGRGFLNMGKGFAEGFALEIDEEAMNAAVEAYNNRVNRQTRELNKTIDALDEAYLSAPTFRAESARAETFGARALTEFKGNPLYTVPGDSESNHKYPVDLANQEGIHGSHVIDKHVGKTDMQLAARLRDQPDIDAASGFTDLSQAQKTTQDVIDYKGPAKNSGQTNAGIDNPKQIEAWLSKPRKDTSLLRLGTVEFQHVTGRTVEATNPSASHAQDTHSATVVLKYKNGLVPPYVVYTSMPSLP